MLYSKKENVLLYSRQDIGLASIKNTTINSDKTIITSNKILLGTAFATEPAMLGETFTVQLRRLLETLVSAANRLKGASSTNPGAAAQSIRLAGSEIEDASTKMLNYLKGRNHLSKIVNIE
jgi:hypothetical protein